MVVQDLRLKTDKEEKIIRVEVKHSVILMVFHIFSPISEHFLSIPFQFSHPEHQNLIKLLNVTLSSAP